MLNSNISLETINSEFHGMFRESLNNLSEQQLIQEYRVGNQAALEELLCRTRQGLHNFIQQSLPDASSAEVEDIVQDVLVTATLKAKSFESRDDARFTTWLFRVATNLIINRSRRRKIVLEVSFSSDEADNNACGHCAGITQESFVCPDPTPEELLFAQEHANEIRECLNALKKRHAIILLLDAEDFTLKEMADYFLAEGLSPNRLTPQAMNSTLKTAKRRFEKLLNERGINTD